MLISDATTVEAGLSTKRATAAALGQEDFLRMLIAQLENQDPLNPQDGTEFTAQLAQFSSLEQEIAMRTTLEKISSALGRSDSSSAIQMIGKQILADSPYLQHDGGSSTLKFDLDTATDTTVVEIRNSSGRLVRSIDLGPLASGEHSREWDGLGQFGSPVEPGVYTTTVTAAFGGNVVGSRTVRLGVVSGADISGDDALLHVGDIVIPISKVLEVRALASTGVTP